MRVAVYTHEGWAYLEDVAMLVIWNTVVNKYKLWILYDLFSHSLWIDSSHEQEQKLGKFFLYVCNSKKIKELFASTH